MLLDGAGHESLEDIRAVLHLALEGHHQQRGHVAEVLGGQGPLLLQDFDEDHQEGLVGQQVAELPQTLLDIVLPHASNLTMKRNIIKDARSSQVGLHHGL